MALHVISAMVSTVIFLAILWTVFMGLMRLLVLLYLWVSIPHRALTKDDRPVVRDVVIEGVHPGRETRIMGMRETVRHTDDVHTFDVAVSFHDLDPVSPLHLRHHTILTSGMGMMN